MQEDLESKLEKVTDTFGDLVTGVPAPIRKNLFKAFAQLCTAAIDLPVAKLESRAAEIRAASAARIKIIQTEGEHISEQLSVPKEYVSKASEKFAAKVIKEQLNLDQIGHYAANNLKQEAFDNTDEKNIDEISDDWLNEFENYAKLKSSEDMKLIFGKILSGEVRKPGTFSIRTIRLISQLDNKAAKLFQRLCSLCVSMYIERSLIYDARVVSIYGNAGTNSLIKYGLSFDNLNVLQEYGLIISDYNSWMNYAPCIANERNESQAVLCYGNKHYRLTPTDTKKYDKRLKLSGVALTTAGKELFKIIPIEDFPSYKKDLDEFFAKKHLKLIELKSC